MCFCWAFSLLLTIFNLILNPVLPKLSVLLPPEQSPTMMREWALNMLNNNNVKSKCVVITGCPTGACHSLPLSVIFTIKFCVEREVEKPCRANASRLQAVVNRVSNIQKMNMQPPEKHIQWKEMDSQIRKFSTREERDLICEREKKRCSWFPPYW